MSPHQSVCTSKIEPCVPRLQWSSHDPLLCRRQLCHGVRGNIAASALSHQDSSSMKFPTLAVVSLGVQNASSVATHWVHLEPEEASIPRSGGFVEDLNLLCAGGFPQVRSQAIGFGTVWYNNLQNDTICINMFMHSMKCTYIAIIIMDGEGNIVADYITASVRSSQFSLMFKRDQDQIFLPGPLPRC